MLTSPAVLALAASPALAAYVGFNYGATFSNGAVKVQSDYEADFKAAQALISAPQTFSSARIYTMIQGGTTNSVNQAIPAAISTKTSLLLGLWASAGDADFANEIAALKSAISTYGSTLAGQVAGISVGSEDLYRISPTGIANNENPGVGPDVLVNYIGQVKAAIANTAFASVPVGHVDTWTAWVNASNSAVASASDWVGVDAYPYFQTTVANSISTGQSLFDSAVDQTKAAVGGKPVWITETGWPVSGPTAGQAVASIDNAKTYWDEVGCSLFGSTNTWWYTLQDAAPDTPSPSFGIVGSTLSSTPLFDLSCNASSSSTSTATGTASTGVSASAVATGGTGSGSPGISAGVPGSGTSATGVTTAAGSSPSGGGSGSGSGSSSGPSSASGAGSNATYTSSVPAATSSLVTTNNAAANVVSYVAAFVALMAASLVL